MTTDMTKGDVKKQLLLFSMPLILGNLFQLTYNAVDTIIVGKFAGMDALAGVGTSNPVMNIVILGINGICIGASVLMSEYFGAGEYDKLKKEVSTTLVFGVFFSLILVAFGWLLSGNILKAMGVPKNIVGNAANYLRIVFTGMPFVYAYNAYAAAMRSIGDAKTPLKFLALSSVMNACLDYVLIAGLHMGVTGAALGTVIAQIMSVVLCVVYIHIKVPHLRLKRKEIKLDAGMLKLTLRHGSITALQQSCQPVGKLLIQGVVNSLGVSGMAAFNAVSRVDDFAFIPEQSISHGMMTFIAQNRGAKQKERVKQGLRQGLVMEFCYWATICVVILLFRRPIMKLFVSEEETQIIALGAGYLGLMAFLYIFPAFTNGLQGYFRGMGDMKATLISTLIQISIRVLFVSMLVPHFGLIAIPYACMLGWIFMLLYQVPYYFRTFKSKE